MNSSESILSEKDPFKLIEQGYESKTKLSYFKASEAYLSASLILDEKAVDTFPIKPRNAKEIEQGKIAALYRDKSLEYFHEARRCFVSGLEQEYDLDVATLKKHPSTVEQVSKGTWSEDSTSLEHIVNSLTEQDLSTRQELFHQLFMVNDDPKDEQTQTFVHKDTTKSLEERLAMLESSLPSRLKSDHERFTDLNKGLKDLGVINHCTAPTSHLYLDEMESLDEEKQVDQIVQMATDSVTLEGGMDSNRIYVMDSLEKSYLQHEEDNSDIGNSIYENAMDDTMNYEPNMEQVRNLIQRITRIEVDEKERLCKSETQNDTQHQSFKTKNEALKDWIEEAQQLLLQVSLCLNESDVDSNQNDDDNVSQRQNLDCFSEALGEKAAHELENVDKESNAIDKNPILEIGKDSLLQIQTLVEQMLASWPK